MNLEELQKRLQGLFTQGSRAIGTAQKIANPLPTVANYAAKQVIKSPQVQRVMNSKIVPGQKASLNQIGQQIRSNPSNFILSSAAAQGKLGLGNQAFNKNVARPVGHALNTLINTSSLGIVNPPSAPVQTKQDMIGAGLGLTAGLVNPYSVGAKITGPLGKGIEKVLTNKITSKPLPTLAKRALPMIAGEAAQTAALTAGKTATGQQFDPLSDLGQSVGIRGLLKVPGGLQKAIPKKDYIKHVLEHQNGIDDVIRRYEQSRPLANSGTGVVKMPDIQGENVLIEDATYIWKQIFGENKKPPETLGKVVGDLNEAWSGALAEQELMKQRSNIPYMGMGIRSGLVQEAEDFIPAKLPPGVKGTQDNSVLEGLEKGFEAGRNARKQGEQQAKGSTGQQVRSQVIDDLTPVFDMVKTGGKAAAGEADAYQKMRLLRGLGGKADAFIKERLQPVLQRVGERRVGLSALMVLQREQELVKRGLNRTRNLAQAEQGINELRARYGGEGLAALEAEAAEVRKVGSELLEMLRGSIIDEDTYQAIKKNNEFYAPFEAVEHMADNIAKGEFGNGSYNVASQDAIKKIGDYMGDVADPLETLVRKIPKIIALTEKNKALKSFVDLRHIRDGNVYGELIKPAKGDSVPEGYGTINVFENGKNVKYLVPEVAANAIKHLDAESANILVKLGSAQAKLLRAGTVTFSIGFIPVNIMRDVQDASMTVLTEKGLKGFAQFLSQYPRAIFSAAGKTDGYKRWVASGGSGGTLTEQVFKNTPQTVAELAGEKPILNRLNPIKNTGALLKFLGRVGEESTRLARYNAGVDNFKETSDLAAFKSRDVSLDFLKSGNSVKTLNKVVPFLNAGIQGSEKLIRLYKDNPKAAIAATGIMYGVPTFMLYNHNSQFADYDDIPESEKQENWIILARDRTEEEIAAGDSPIGIKVPKGFIGRPVANTVESALSFMEKPDPETLVGSAVDTVAGISPVGLPVTPDRFGETLSKTLPPVVKAGVEWATGTNLHTGINIVPQSLENLPEKEQYRETTPNVYKIAGQVTGQSPLKIENTVNTTMGGLGRQVAQLVSDPTNVNSYTADQVTRRFVNIKDGKKANDAYALVDEEKGYTAQRNRDLKKAAMEGDWTEVERLAKGMTSQQINTLIMNEYKKEAKKNLTPTQRAYQSLSQEEQRRVLFERPELQSEISLIPEAEAAGEMDTMSYQSSIKDSIAESTAKSRVQFSGKAEGVNGKYFYINKNGNVASIKTDHAVEEPEMTGDEVLDKEIRKDYYTEINAKRQDIIDLVKLKYYSPEKARQELAKLDALKGGSGKGKGVKDVARAKISAGTVRFSPIKSRKIQTVKLQGPTKSVSIQKVGPSKKVRLATPSAKFSYKITRPKLQGLRQGVKIV